MKFETFYTKLTTIIENPIKTTAGLKRLNKACEKSESFDDLRYLVSAPNNDGLPVIQKILSAEIHTVTNQKVQSELRDLQRHINSFSAKDYDEVREDTSIPDRINTPTQGVTREHLQNAKSAD